MFILFVINYFSSLWEPLSAQRLRGFDGNTPKARNYLAAVRLLAQGTASGDDIRGGMNGTALAPLVMLDQSHGMEIELRILNQKLIGRSPWSNMSHHLARS